MKKKNKKNSIIKKELTQGAIIITLLLLILVTYVIFYTNNKEKNKNNINKFNDKSSNYLYILKDNSFVKVTKDNDNTIPKEYNGKYNCINDNCDIYENSLFSPIYDDKYIVLKENDKIFIYDYRLENVVSNYYDEITYKKDDYFIVKENNLYGLINLSGNSLIPQDYEEIDIDNIYNNLVKVKLNNKYGIYDIKNNKLLINTEYDNISITDNNYFNVSKDNLWFIIDKDNNTITNSYKYTYAFNKGFLAVDDNNIKILKYNLEEELLNDNIIEFTTDYKISRKSSIITITIIDKIYEYEINRNNLIIK